MKSDPLIWYRLRWPRETDEEQVTQAFRLLAVSAGKPVILEVVGSSGEVAHNLALQLGRAGGVVNQLRTAIPGLAIEKLDERPSMKIDRAVEIRLSTSRRPLRTDDLSGASKAVLTALAHVGHGERLVLQYALGRRLAATTVPHHLEQPQSLMNALLGTPPPARTVDPDIRNALRAKRAEQGWQVVGRIGVTADSASRQRQLIRQVLGALRTTEAPGVDFWVHSTSSQNMARAAVPWRKRLRLGVSEMAALSGWPVGPTRELPVAKIGSRLVAPSASIRSDGRVIGEATFPGQERPLSLLPIDALRHLLLIAPTGSGKTTLATLLIEEDIRAGRGVVVIEPKGDLIEDVLKRIPPERIQDVVLVEPSDNGSSQVVGINPLAPAGRRPELVADQLAGLFRHFFTSDAPRTFDILNAALLTAVLTPGSTLASLTLLLSDDGFRRRAIANIDNPWLEDFWSGFQALSESDRNNAIAPALRRLRPFLLRPDVRAAVNQTKPGFDIRQVFTERKILLVNLSAGLLGGQTAGILSGMILSQLWQAALGRAAIAPERRHFVPVYVDEASSYLHLPTDMNDALAQARGMGVGFVLCFQFLQQLNPALRAGALANIQSIVAWRLSHEDARILAAGSALDPEDFQSLGAFQAYAQLVANGTVQPWCSIRTRLPDDPISDPQMVRAASQKRYGVSREQIEADIRALVRPRPEAEGHGIGSRRRVPGGAA